MDATDPPAVTAPVFGSSRPADASPSWQALPGG